jgi:hypothetical protein
VGCDDGLGIFFPLVLSVAREGRVEASGKVRSFDSAANAATLRTNGEFQLSLVVPFEPHPHLNPPLEGEEFCLVAGLPRSSDRGEASADRRAVADRRLPTNPAATCSSPSILPLKGRSFLFGSQAFHAAAIAEKQAQIVARLPIVDSPQIRPRPIPPPSRGRPGGGWGKASSAYESALGRVPAIDRDRCARNKIGRAAR